MTVGQRGSLFEWGSSLATAHSAESLEVAKHGDTGYVALYNSDRGYMTFDPGTGQHVSWATSPGSWERVSFTGPCVVVAQPGDSGTVRRYEWVNRV